MAASSNRLCTANAWQAKQSLRPATLRPLYRFRALPEHGRRRKQLEAATVIPQAATLDGIADLTDSVHAHLLQSELELDDPDEYKLQLKCLLKDLCSRTDDCKASEDISSVLQRLEVLASQDASSLRLPECFLGQYQSLCSTALDGVQCGTNTLQQLASNCFHPQHLEVELQRAVVTFKAGGNTAFTFTQEIPFTVRGRDGVRGVFGKLGTYALQGSSCSVRVHGAYIRPAGTPIKSWAAVFAAENHGIDDLGTVFKMVSGEIQLQILYHDGDMMVCRTATDDIHVLDCL